jgi:hypothetical protein
MNQGYFLLRGLDKVRAEMSLTVLAYNMKRVITILGIRKLLEVALSGMSNCVPLFIQLHSGVLAAGWRCAIRILCGIFTQSGAVLGAERAITRPMEQGGGVLWHSTPCSPRD